MLAPDNYLPQNRAWVVSVSTSGVCSWHSPSILFGAASGHGVGFTWMIICGQKGWLSMTNLVPVLVLKKG